MAPKELLNQFKTIFPFWAPRVAKWQPKGPSSIKITLNDGNVFLFSHEAEGWELKSSKGGIVKYDGNHDSR